MTISGNITADGNGGFTASGESISLSWRGPGGAEVGVKLTPNGMVPHPTDPSAPMVPSAKAEGTIGFKKFTLDIPLAENFTMNDLFDRELNGPLSSGLLGDAYTKLLHRKRDLDQAIEDTENGIDPNTRRNFDRARNFSARRDPLVLDLDGDGIETVGSDSGEVLFDHEGDGIRNGSGWLKPDDGFLVWDRNGNGVIDNGGELFGDMTAGSGMEGDPNTLPPDSPERVRSAGLRALSRLDTNKDDVFDANDAEFANVRVWRDLNQDGQSSANELFTLSQLNIASINLNPTSTTNVDLRNGNIIDTTGSFTRTDGSTGVTGDLLLGNNNFYRDFTDHIELSEAAKQLPALVGAGLVRDLAEAATLDPQLAAAVNGMSDGMSRNEMMSRMDAFLARWADTSTMQSSYEAMWGGGGFGAVKLNVFGRNVGQLTDMISVLERFNGQHYFTGVGAGVSANNRFWGVEPVEPGTVVQYFVINVDIDETPAKLLREAYEQLRDSVYYGLVMFTRLQNYMAEVNLVLDPVRGFVFDFDAMDQKLRDKAFGGDVDGALDDLYDLYRANSGLFKGWEWSDTLGAMAEHAQFSGEFVGRAVQLFGTNVFGGHLGTAASQDDDLVIGGATGDVIVGSGGNDVLVGYSGDDSLNGGAGNDKLYGGSGNDTLEGEGGNDVLEGGDGDDVITDGSGTNVLRGGAGNDILRSTSPWAVNTFIGGSGDDTMSGYYGGDTYVFNVGDGRDTISDNGAYSSTGEYADTLSFGEDIAPADIKVDRVGDDLVFTHRNGVDQITVKNWYVSAGNWLENVRFADGTSWSAYDLTYKYTQIGSDADQTLTGVNGSNAVIRAGGGSDTIVSGDGNDELHGEAGNDTISAGSGNDKVFGGAGNDTIEGGSGNDVLEGGDGDDVISDGSGTNVLRGGAGDDILKGTDPWVVNTFEGGTGNDTMSGYYGGDTYLFNLGDGQDTINDNGAYSSAAPYADTLR
ncbi:calcium-binding protein, partial [Pseudomonas sp. CGJS7]|uniref:calcium-binding protein n=1 Tax=Pseudomonas sp. CGJS7 TaxID=3109348 RepID=UPI00300A748B